MILLLYWQCAIIVASTPFQVFKKIAKRGKASTRYFYGFKLHLIINDKGEILASMLTPGNMETQAPVSDLSKNIFGKMFNELAYSLGRIEADLECFLIR
ncbi:transposase [Neochlamydia sp. S13]|uniref:transposase n=1 Tax=Neochlamydia sp. S13 TaxID=1353976 RepID=UPI00069446F6|nr:transposase [Neochlamydia sp. S13]BBI18192.1 Transposase IS4 family protein [Neochlamydia sp. S13]